MKAYPWLKRGNNTYKGVLLFQMAMTLVIGFFTDSVVLGLIIGALILAGPLALFALQKHATYTRHVAVIATQLFAALHIQQSMGATYMHFEIFAVMAVTTVYRDWKVLISSVVVVAAHHVGFYALQISQAPVFIFEPQYLSLYILGIHAFFAVAEGVILGFIAQQTFKDGYESLQLQRAIDNMMKPNEHFDLNINSSGTSVTSCQFNKLIQSVNGFIGQTKSVGDSISDVSSAVGTLANDVKQASLDTSGQVVTIASAVEEMTVNNESVAQRASTVNKLSATAKDASSKAKNIVVESNNEVNSLQQDLNKTSMAISELSEKCQKIESVMAAITAISDQTNLLALNAAIESARAGEHGRGFAVVADEVRQLAMRTKDNTEQISEITHSLIQNSNASVEQMNVCLEKSAKVIASSGSAVSIIDEVATSITSVSDNIASVSLAIDEQTQASNEISRSTSLLSSTSESLSTNADKTGDSFAELENNVRRLQTELSRFQ